MTESMRNNKRISLLAFFFLFAVTACDDDDTDDLPDPDMGVATINITGDVELDFQSYSIFGQDTDSDTGLDIFFISNVTDEDQPGDMLLATSGTKPGTGSFPIVFMNFEDEFPEDAFVSSVSYQMEDGEETQTYLFQSEQGTVTFDESGSSKVSGSFEFSATGMLIPGGEMDLEVEITGTFDAIPGYLNGN